MHSKPGSQVVVLIACVAVLIAVLAPMTAAQTLESVTFSNPIDIGIADPCVIRASDGRFYLYSTGLSVWSSDDLVNWKHEGNVKPSNTWGVADFWAPEVVEYEDSFYLFYSAERLQGGKRIGVAISESPIGPFVDRGKPLFDFGYAAIDASPFIDDDGRKYLFYSKDQMGTGGGRYESHSYGIELSDDFFSVIGEPVLLTKPDQGWEMYSGNHLWNEGQYVIKHNGTYYLMYSANYFGGPDYSVGYATSDYPLGPYVKYQNNPILSRGSWIGKISGPGHHSVCRSPDGNEWFIIYHVHADPAVGGGNRRLSIDRMGFRQDGSIYVNGPTLTPQPKPAGATPLVNLAPQAAVKASSVKSSHRVEALTDGEIVTQIRNSQYDWVSKDGENSWVRLEWTHPQRVKYLFLYGSISSGRRISQGTVSFGNEQTPIGKIAVDEFPKEPGAAAIITLPDDQDITWIEFRIDELVSKRGEAALTEVVVLGYPLGYVWFSSVVEGTQITDLTPICVQAPGITLERVQIDINGQTVYEGDCLPTELVLNPSQLDRGYYDIFATMIDKDGQEHCCSTRCTVEHIDLVKPAPGTWLTGEVSIEVAPLIPSCEFADVRIDLERVVADTRVSRPMDTTGIDRMSFQAMSLSQEFTLNTLSLEDGAYDIVIHATTVHGIQSERRERVVISNWNVLEDHILPPKDLGWFGTTEALKTTKKSSGWHYTGDDPELFFGDRDRIMRSGEKDEYLIWNMANLHRYALTLYSKDPAIEESILIETSADGRTWHMVPYVVDLVYPEKSNSNPWLELNVTGKVPKTSDAKFLRLTFTNKGLSKDALQLGYVRLIGAKDPGLLHLIVD
ncbi:MAG: glycoside hydrolase family 43 protein [Limnochordia bacterium]|nr:glycoside hydrolase family 43 protein [Limnochordia bacterium]